MKKNIENSFKDSLGNHEMPYNAAAWTSLSAKLDAKMPTSPKSNFKWYATASTIVVIAVSSYFIFKTDEAIPTQNDVVTSQNEVATTENTSLNNENTNPVNQNNANVPQDLTEEQNSNDLSAPTVNVEPNNINNENNLNPLTNNGGSIDPISTETYKNGDPLKIVEFEPGIKPASNLMLPTITDICEGATFVVENVNDEALLIEGPEMHYIVPANSKRTVRAKASGLHTIGSMNMETPRNEFFVKNAVTAEFSIDSENKFENGLPTTKVVANATGINYSWIFNNQKVNGREANAHFYTKGNHDISLTVTGSNGCTNTITKSIYVDEKYNLMAENAFIPTDTDPRNSTFMPFALKERNVNFVLRIYDTRDGHVIFESNDASNGWNGIDMKTGRMVAYEQAYIWKVIIENPEPNEINEYGGSIMPIPLK